MITIENIHKSFGALEVLKGIDLHIDKGEVVSIVGPSGAGKTTLLQIIGTLDKPDAGRVVVDGIDTSKLSTKKLSDFRNQHLGFVFQFHQLLPEFTALENIMIPAYIAGVSQKEAKKRAKELLAFMGLSERASHKPNELSGGEKQRVAVARALINNPAVILADEPSGSLDSKNKAELHQLFFDLRDKFGQTFVIVTHDEGLAELTDRTIHLKDGVIIDAEHVKLQMCPHYIPKPEGYGLADTVQHMKDTNEYRMKLLRNPELLETINRELRAVDDIYFERYMTFLDRKQPSFYEEALIRQGAIQRGEPVNLVQGAGYFAPIRL